MSQKIYINFININIEKQINDENFNTVIIQINNDNKIVIFSNKYYIRYDINENIINKKYFIEINDIDPNNLITSNFTFQIQKSISFTYSYFNEEPNKSIIFYNNYNYIPFIFMGLPNLRSPLEVKINYGLSSVLASDTSGNQLITLFNNYQGTYNYFGNTIYLNGSIYKINISDSGGITNNNPTNQYKIFQIQPDIYIDLNTNIYFYNDIPIYSYILYLNNYNFSDYKINSENYESIILLIEYIDTSGNIYSIINSSNDNSIGCVDCTFNDCNVLDECEDQIPPYTTYFYTYDSSGNKQEIQVDLNITPSYSLVLSLDLQTFNSKQLNVPNNQEYYNALFFKNYINDNYFVKSIKMFCYDYEKYFINTFKAPQLYNIGEYHKNLYQKLIKNNTNLLKPLIFDLSKYEIFLMNLDMIQLVKLININSTNNYLNKLLISNKINLETLVNYLANFKIKKYNIYKINNFYNKTKFISLVDINIDQINLFNYNYNYDDKNTYVNKNNTSNSYVDFNNNILNCIECKIMFLYLFNEKYSVFGKLFLDNYNIQIYHKKYDIFNNDDKKQLIKMLLLLASTSWGINIIFYNNINSKPFIISDNSQYLLINQYYLFNQINLSKKSNEFDIFFNITSKNNCYTNQYLKLNINFKLNYYILFLYSDKLTFLDTYTELVFSYSQYIFKILKIPESNGNMYTNKNIFYIVFQNLKELNIFMNYLKTGIFDLNIQKISNYFNIIKSVVFCNYYNINNYWILNKLPQPMVSTNDPTIALKYKIIFSINNLEAKQIYLYGNMSINAV